ncbi:beta-galactosidase 8 isoform X1 [Dioscorea cayenensis subsp. rotundata]|uniref:Beta-galactosidase n=1 Tax=Dioscorea cayennensis subsp. rotundata TaxID=55577 RepID=A0AB40AMD5_DIOCR|nr:beta-galactosidase 8 isoform X1 [Dioscorea cayenensis subsp. rotundata]XP_039116177.1 beta-galactosidase 8 isoform X1 [Dioscorea cayenensis subsp. rotundata]
MSKRRTVGSACARAMASSWSFKLLLVLLSIVSLASFFPALPALSSPRSHHSKSEGGDRGFWIADDKFWKDGQPFQIIGGDLHYFRVVPQYWKDRLLRAKALGLNTIQTYVPWNLHEPSPEKWVFDGMADIESFLRLAQELGFLVMLRAGPYICGEWDLGGFPAWLLNIEPALKLRSSDPSFLRLVDKWWGVLLPKILPLLYNKGGPIIMVQVENEFGSYGDDQPYLRHLVALARRYLGNEIILYTTDGGSRDLLDKGTIRGEEVYSAVDFSTGDDPWPIFQLQKKYNSRGKSPPLIAEFYTGWLTHWGERIAETDANFTAAALEKILSLNASAVLYMAHGGTNFGFFSGANTGDNETDYKADLTSYDYDAPIKESGDVENLKFEALRNVSQKYSRGSLPPFPSNNERTRYGPVKVSKVSSLLELLHVLRDPMGVIERDQPVPMESIGQLYGFLLYTSEYSQKKTGSIISIPKVHDRAQVFIQCSLNDNERSLRFIGAIERWSNRELAVPYIKCSSNVSVLVLVENMGRLNYGPYIHDRKGILSAVILDGIILHRWRFYPVSFNNLSSVLRVNPIMQVADPQNEGMTEEPRFYQGSFFIDHKNQVKDTYISFHGWTKGIAFINNFNIGRFWPVKGPQCSLYVPAPILQHGENIVVILELHSPHPELILNLVKNPDFSCGGT